MSWEDASFVIRSRLRKTILLETQRPKTPTILTRQLHTSIANVSRTLKELYDAGLVELVTPKARTGKIYLISEKGRKTLQKIQQMEA